MTAWFRRPDDVLVAARHSDQESLFIHRGYKPVDTDEAVAEVESGKQAELNAERRESDITARERQLAADRQRKAQARRDAARKLVADAQQPDPKGQDGEGPTPPDGKPADGAHTRVDPPTDPPKKDPKKDR